MIELQRKNRCRTTQRMLGLGGADPWGENLMEGFSYRPEIAFGQTLGHYKMQKSQVNFGERN